MSSGEWRKLSELSATEQRLVTACRKGDVEAVTAALKAVTVTSAGAQSLQWDTLQHCVDNALGAFGAPIDPINKLAALKEAADISVWNGVSAVEAAYPSVSADVREWLWNHLNTAAFTAIPHPYPWDNETFIERAAVFDNLSAVRWLLEDKRQTQLLNDSNQSLLHRAAVGGHHAVLQYLLLKHDMDPNSKNKVCAAVVAVSLCVSLQFVALCTISTAAPCSPSQWVTPRLSWR